MAGIIPRRKIKGVDFCGSKDYCYIIRSDLGCYMRAKNFNKGSDLSIHALHPDCHHGDHYFADENGQFYIIKGDQCRRVTALTEDTDSTVFTLHHNCQGGDHYLSTFGWFYIIFQEKGTCRRTADLSNDSDSEEFILHPNCRDGLYYWGDKDHFYILKPTSEWGVENYKCKDFHKVFTFDKGTAEFTAVLSVHRDVLNFLPGGLSITSGPAFSKWVCIKTVRNQSPTPKTCQKKITKRVGYSKEKMSQITKHWKIQTSGKISAGKLAGLISDAEFTLSGLYGGSRVYTEMEIWNKEKPQLSFELKPNQRLYVWQYQLGFGSEAVLFCKDWKITDNPNPPPRVPLPRVNSPVPEGLQENTSTKTGREEAVPALIMEPADTLCASLFRWLENRKECAEELLKMTENVPQGIAQVLGFATSVFSLAGAGGDAAKAGTAVRVTCTLVETGVSSSAFNKATELIKEDEKAGTNIQKLLRDLKVRCGETLKVRCGETLKDRCGETLKDRCGEAPLAAHADELDCEVTTLLMWALARRSNTLVSLDFLRGFNRATFFRHMTPGGLAPAEASDFICQALRLDRSPEITSSLKVSAKEMMKNIELIGVKASAEAGSEEQGATGLGISLYDLIVKTEELVKGNQVTKASKFLRDSAREILDGQQKLKEQLDAMHEIIQKLFRLKNLIEDLGGYSLSMTENGWDIVHYIMGICTDNTVLSGLDGLPNQTEFVNLLRFCLERLGPFLKKENLLLEQDRLHIDLDIVIVGHGRIDDQFMSAGVLVPADNIIDTILYSPWNCAIDPNAAYAIAQGNIEEANREFPNMAYHEPIPLPDHWNSMRESLHNIPWIHLSPVTPTEDAWALFQQFWVNRGVELEGRVIFPYLVPQHQVNAFREIPLFMYILAISYILSIHGKSATVHLAACLSRSRETPSRPGEWATQYAYTMPDGTFMTVNLDLGDRNMNLMLYTALRSMFDRNRR